MRTLPWLAVLLAALLAPRPAATECATGDVIFDTLKPAKSLQFQDYEIRLYAQDGCQAPPDSRIAGFTISKAGALLYRQTGHSFAVGYPLEQDQPPDAVKIRPGDDVTGDGIPDLLVSEWSGGAHCCYTFHLFQLGASFKKIQGLPLRDADESAFVRRPGVKGLVLNSYDYSAFAYFPHSFAGSPAGRVLLSFQGERFRLDLPDMKTNAPSPAELQKCAALFKKSRAWKESGNDGQPMGMWYYATDLIYTGNESDAWTFLDVAWGGGNSDKTKYLDDYRRRYQKSFYYQDLRRLQASPPSISRQKVDWTKQCFEYLRG